MSRINICNLTKEEINLVNQLDILQITDDYNINSLLEDKIKSIIYDNYDNIMLYLDNLYNTMEKLYEKKQTLHNKQ